MSAPQVKWAVARSEDDEWDIVSSVGYNQGGPPNRPDHAFRIRHGNSLTSTCPAVFARCLTLPWGETAQSLLTVT